MTEGISRAGFAEVRRLHPGSIAIPASLGASDAATVLRKP